MGYIGRDNRVVSFTKQSFTANGVLTSFTLDYGVGDSSGILVSVGGVVQQPGVAYTASGTTLSFTAAPGIGTPVWVVYLGKELFSQKGRVYGNADSQIGTGNGTATPLTLSHSVTNPQSIIVTLNGVAQVPTTDYTVSGTTLTFVAAPNSSKEIIVYFLELESSATYIPDGSITVAKLAASGTLPAWNGSALTNLDAADLTGALPAIDGSALTNQPGPIVKSASDPLPNANLALGTMHLNHTSGQMWVLTDATTDLNTWTNVGTGTGDIENATAPTNPTNTANFTSINENASYNFTFSGATDPDAGDSVTHYHVDQISDGASLSVSAASVAAGSAHTFTAGNVGVNTNVTFRVRARDSYGKYSSGITITTTINNDELPSNPNNGAAFADMNDSTSYNYTFAGATDDNGVTHYMVDQISNAALTVNAAEVTAGSAHTFNAGSVGSDTAVTFRVRAKDTVGQYSSGVTVSMTVINFIPYVATGGSITTVGNYKIHVFNSSSSLNVTQVGLGTVDYMVVGAGGGGGGGWNAGGGGGAGGYRAFTSQSLSVASYNIVVGGGGAGGSWQASSGNSTSFNSISSNGGGSGATHANGSTAEITPGTGGSGGGASPMSPNSMSGGAGNTPSVSPSQGNNGGNGHNSYWQGGGGGGGASAVGQNVTTANASGGNWSGGNGGAGTSNSITGTAKLYSGGGGGGGSSIAWAGYHTATGGGEGITGRGAISNDAGNGSATVTAAQAGDENRGGGGGGGAGYYNATARNGANGGKGVVIVRYQYQ